MEQLVLRVRRPELFSDFFAKELSFAVAVIETAKLFKIVECKYYKILASNKATGRQNLL